MRKILALWAHSRARSTAFERMMRERGDFFVIHEPFGPYYYFSGERISDNKSEVEARPEYGFEAILQRLWQEASSKPVFIKDHALYVAERANQAFLSHFQHTFLIRHPAQALPSLFARMPNFTLQEAGYAESYQLFELTKTVQTAVVIDADDLVKSPAATIRAYCEAVEIPFLSEALSWQAKSMTKSNWSDDGNWSESWNASRWHSHLESSQGFQKKPNRNYVAVEENEHLRQAYEFCLPYYEKLYEHRLLIT